ncbi:MAG: hypothetical protein M1828_002839 [Chrysothrix sp. TS-e1954]|nr:MAG: hypothetical protein M1828_002839 [Chrysothrix sp. TS-e1954]
MAARSPASSSIRPNSLTSSTNPTISPLAARIAEKKRELSDLRELRDLSGTLASQMAQLEEKLSTLAGGTEAVAAVLSNWHNVLRAVSMASMKVPKPKGEDDEEAKGANEEMELPQTLVRIPVQQTQVQGQRPER